MITKHAPATLRKPPKREHGTGDLDPAKLSATLRTLASRAHQLVRTASDTGSQAVDSAPRRELAEVHEQIVRLQRNLSLHQMHSLATYVSALRERVEECLA